jgi:hypothetical protein
VVECLTSVAFGPILWGGMVQYSDTKVRCDAFDNARQCRKHAVRRYRDRPLCRRHYDRALRKNGETRTDRELRAIEAIEAINRRKAQRKGQE